MKNDRIEIKKENIPYRFTISLPKNPYILEFRYNETGDFFTAALYSVSGDLVCIEPIVYRRPLFRQMYRPDDFPPLKIVPVDNSGTSSRVSWDNFGETVFLEVENGKQKDFTV